MTSLAATMIPVLLPAIASAAPLTIDLTAPAAPAQASPYGPGTTRDPQGHEITLDSRSFFLDGKPWIPVSGEFHYSRYPRAEWRDELLKMKAGGITVVSTYVFWIHQEEVQGQWDWTGQRSLRDFLKLCQEVGLKAFVRMGPWSHGEVRNGGFPDWVQHSGTRLRTADPAFMELVKPLYAEEAKQMQGLLWKDGGPVIGVQLDNECADAAYLLALKALARAEGIDVPYYAVTGWQGGLPAKDLIPLFGGYCDGFWGGSLETYRKEFLFSPVRDTGDLGAQMTDKNPASSRLIAQFPYACVEIGAGMMSSYKKRIKIDPDAVAALALAKLGSGSNLQGYYMYQGGINPDGKLTTLEEDHPDQMPVKDYDFQTALGACGQVREQFHLLREQHLFLRDFGAKLARMTPFFPAKQPASLDDFETLRWDIRSDGTSGFLFFSNEQPYVPLPEHKDVQFQVKTAGGTLLIPRNPVTIRSGSYGIWPVNLDCDGVTLEYATAQPLCRVDAGGGVIVYYFTALTGIAPELVFPANRYSVTRATALSAEVAKPNGGAVKFIVLASDQDRQMRPGAPLSVPVTRVEPAGPKAASLTGAGEAVWTDAAVYTLAIPAAAAGRHVILNIHYIGDAARLYIGGKLYDDNFFNGDPFAIGLWRIPASDWAALRLKILPYSDALAARLPEEARRKAADAKAASALDEVTASIAEQF